MSIKRIMIAAIAALGLSAVAFSASAAPAITPAKSFSTFMLLKVGYVGHHHYNFHPGNHPGFHPGYRPGMRFGGPGRPGWGYGGRRGYWRGGRWYWGAPLVGLGIYGYGNGCYWNCINSGYGPGYCQAYAYNFCY